MMPLLEKEGKSSPFVFSANVGNLVQTLKKTYKAVSWKHLFLDPKPQLPMDHSFSSVLDQKTYLMRLSIMASMSWEKQVTFLEQMWDMVHVQN